METDWKKKYEEALERARALREEAIEKEYVNDYVKDYEAIFPELAESEDERIRKAALEGIEYLERKLGWDAIGDTDILDVKEYLEKQKDSPIPEDTVIFQKGVAEGRRLEREDLPYWQTFKGIGIIVPDDYILAKFGKGYKLLRPGDNIEIGTEFLQVSQLDNLPNEEQQKEQKPRWEINNPHTTKWTKEMIDEKFEELVEKKHAEKQDYSGLNDLERAIFRGFLAAGVENVSVGIIKDTASECIGFLALIDDKPAEFSEDERARKWILEYLYDGLRKADEQFKEQFKSSIAWLEKQKEQTEELSTRLNGLMQKYVKSGKDEEEQDHRLKCYQLFWDALGDSEFFEQKEQKPAEWSKNDTVFLNEIIEFFENKTVRLQHDLDMYAHWLKSLPERFSLQPKPEWSKEEKRKLNRIYAILGQAADTHAFSTTCRLIGDKEAVELQDFLRSIAKPKSSDTWKPSEEQMRAL